MVFVVPADGAGTARRQFDCLVCEGVPDPMHKVRDVGVAECVGVQLNVMHGALQLKKRTIICDTYNSAGSSVMVDLGLR